MTKKEETQPRINLIIPMDMSIKIEMESDKRGINRTQFIKEAIHEKLNKSNNDFITQDIQKIKGDLEDIKESMKELRSIILLSTK